MAGNPIQFDGLDHLVLKVADLQKSLDFYVGVLGLHVERIIDGVDFCQVRCGRNLIDLQKFPEEARAQGSKGNVDHFCLNARGDIDEILTYLQTMEVSIKAPPSETYGSTGFGTSIYVFDPDQNVVEIKTNYAQFPIKSSVAEALNASTRPRAKG